MQRLIAALALALFSGIALAAVNLNSATKDELVALPGIGPAKAQAIIDHRKAHGPFKSVEELKDVKGIGAKRFEKLKPELTVAGPSAAKVPAKPDAAPAKGASASRTAQGELTATAKRDAPAGPSR